MVNNTGITGSSSSPWALIKQASNAIRTILATMGFMKDLQEEKEEAEKLRRKLVELRYARGEAEFNEMEESVLTQMEVVRKKREELNKQGKFVMWGLGGGINALSSQPSEDDWLRLKAEELQAQTDAYNLEKERFELAQIRYEFGKTDIEGMKQAYDYMISSTKNEKEKNQLIVERKRLLGDTSQGTQVFSESKNLVSDSRASNPRKLDATTPQSLFGGVELGKPKLSKVPTTPPEQSAKQAKETFSELSALNESFQNSFNSGMQAIGQSINQSIGGMFRNVFGEANSLLEIFIQNFLSSMASDILSVLTGGVSGGILKILGFAQGGIISEPIFGIGKSGQRYLFGEA